MKFDVLSPKRGMFSLSGLQKSVPVMSYATVGVDSQMTMGEINIHNAKAKMDTVRVEALQVLSRLTFV